MWRLILVVAALALIGLPAMGQTAPSALDEKYKCYPWSDLWLSLTSHEKSIFMVGYVSGRENMYTALSTRLGVPITEIWKNREFYQIENSNEFLDAMDFLYKNPRSSTLEIKIIAVVAENMVSGFDYKSVLDGFQKIQMAECQK